MSQFIYHDLYRSMDILDRSTTPPKLLEAAAVWRFDEETSQTVRVDLE